MDIVSLCPLRVGGFTWQAHTGAYALTVIVKATFLLEPGEAVLAPEQEPLHEQERTWDGDPKRSVRAPSDRAPYKARADVMLVGHAYTPHRQPARSVVVRMIVGEVDKAVEVWCDRGFRIHDDRLLEGRRFVTMPLTWERAAGGPETSNPVGVRSDAAPDRYGMVSLPNLQPAGTYVSQRSDAIAPVGFGPIASRWPARAQKLGRHAGGFHDPGWERAALPSDFDSGYFQAAPADQQVAEVRANERIVLENLHPDHVRLVTALPGIRPRAIVDRATGEREEVALVGDTLWIDSDRGLCCVVWRGRIGLRHASEAGRIAVWVDGMPMVDPAEVHSSQSDSSATQGAEELATLTLVGPLLTPEGATLPFVPGSSKLATSHQGIAADIARWTASMPEDGTGTILGPMLHPPENVLPFKREDDDWRDPDETIPRLPQAVGAPSKAVGAPPPLTPVVPPLQSLQLEDERPFETPFFESTAPAAVRPLDGSTDEPEPARADVPPPPMIGPLAKTERARDAGDVATAPQEPEPDTAELEKDDRPDEAAEDVVELSIEETATIAAELAEGQMERAKVLEAHALSEHAWSKNEARWGATMEEEQGRGKSTLRGAYDAAYVKRVEEFRGAITVEEYATILVGMERGKAEGVLDRLSIQRSALMPVVRVWSKKMAQDMKLGRATTAALRDAREA